jgi:putative phage-type endonuclease
MLLHAPETFGEAELLGVFESGSEDWHKAREGGLGGSEVGTILGLNPYESAYALWCKRTGRIPSQIEENWPIRFGKAFEQPILDLWQEDHPEWEVFLTGTYRSKENSLLHANPDALARHRETGEWMIIEVKTARSTWDSVPQGYVAQVLHYMGVMGIKRGMLVAVAGMTWYEHEVDYNEEQIAIQNEMLLKFWNSVQKDVQPDWDGSDATYQAVRYQHPLIEDVELDVGDIGWQVVNHQLFADSVYTELQKLKSELMSKMGNAKHAYVWQDGQKIRVASRQIRSGSPVMVINKKGK